MGRSLLVVLSFLLVAAPQDRSRLIFSEKIGTDSDDSRWMNFVAISSDGSKVAANGNVPGKAGGLG
jgi:hypothetical protein